jgi:hypothetical protein
MIALLAGFLPGGRLGAYVAIAALAVVLAGGAYLYVERQGYQRGVIEWQAKYDRLVADYAEAKAAEITRLVAANEAAKAREALRIAELARENEELEKLLEEQANASKQDPDRDRVGLGAPSVQRINRIR